MRPAWRDVDRIESARITLAASARKGDSVLTWFGVAAVSAMLLFYALESRSPWFVLAFAGACLASSAYGFLLGSWPFGIVELVWSGVAVVRWRAASKGQRAS